MGQVKTMFVTGARLCAMTWIYCVYELHPPQVTPHRNLQGGQQRYRVHQSRRRDCGHGDWHERVPPPARAMLGGREHVPPPARAMLGGVRVCVLVPLLDSGLLQMCRKRRGRSRRSGGSRKTSGHTDSEIPHRAQSIEAESAAWHWPSAMEINQTARSFRKSTFGAGAQF